MNLTSFFLDKCLAFLFQTEADRVRRDSVTPSTSLSLPPPWSAPEQEFRDLCNGCGACAAACERKLIIIGEDGLPVMDFSKGFCHFCGTCARSCPGGALRFSDEPPRRHLDVSINEHCLTRKKVLCQLCQEQCEQGAIVLLWEGQGVQSPRILSEKCNGCGACIAGCPAHAVSLRYAENQSQDQSLNQSLPRGDA